ncbi:MAG: D-2-hydroxyacid dehydrogenase [Bryobacteraceae bacterium]
MLSALPDHANLAVGERVEAFKNLAPRADVILHWNTSRALLEEVWKMASKVRWVHSRAAGLDTLLFPELISSPAILTNGRGVFSRSLGEFAVAAALFFAKDLRRMTRNQAEGRWEQFDVEELHGRTMGIIGYGDIGRAIAERARPFGMKILAMRRRPELSKDDPLVDEVVGQERTMDVMSESDYVVSALPLTPDTRGLIGGKEIAAMKPNAVIMNLGRGPVIVESELIRALEERRIRGAALDVFDCEPLPAGHPFYRLDNVLLSPHSADHTSDWLDNAMQFFLDNLDRFLKSQPLMNVVEKRLGY